VSDDRANAVDAFLEAACVPLDADHSSGTLERAEAIRAAHPEVAATTIHAAAALGDDAYVRRFVAIDAAAPPSRAARAAGTR
jgi:hypothetical protein